MKKTKEREILKFAEDKWGKKTFHKISNKLFEECGEIAGAIIKIEEDRKSKEDLKAEIGDTLIVLSQLAAKLGTTLEELREERFFAIQLKAAPKPKYSGEHKEVIEAMGLEYGE